MRVLIALDESAVSVRAAREASRLFAGEDTEFLVISVSRLPLLWAGTAGYGMVAALPMDSAVLEAAQETEAELSARAEAAGVKDPVAHTGLGDPVDVICRAAEEHDVDVIVVGSHDKSALRRLFDPSVAVGVARATYRPVLIISGEPPS
ncbi:MAG: universal stress protein [Acidimicrobiia bacterium]|nr:universal stress protein [Acidimicrobiia bacterium]